MLRREPARKQLDFREHAHGIAAGQRPDPEDDFGRAVLSLDDDDWLGITRLKALERAARKSEVCWLRTARDVEDGSALCHVVFCSWPARYVGNEGPASFFHTTPETVHGI